MEKGFLHLHITVTSLFLFLYVLKVFLLAAEKTEAFNKVRSKTKIADMVLGSLIIITGVFLTIKAPIIETYLIVKIVLVLISIPLGIIGMKKANKPMAIAALAIYFYVFLVAKTNSLTLQQDEFVTPAATLDATTGAVVTDEGKIVYDAKCAVCHGANGKLMLNGAKDLSVSELSHDETIARIKEGKGLMPGFNDQLNEKQIQAVAAYIESFKK